MSTNINGSCRCTVCNVIINCGKSELDKHCLGVKHMNKMKTVVSVPQISYFLNANNQMSNEVKRAEIIMTAFYAEHNIAFHTTDHLIPALKRHFPIQKFWNKLS